MGPLFARLSLKGADLRTAALGQLALAGADLRGADLRGVDLTRLNLRGADLRGADLRGAKLVGADLRDVELDAACLEAADCTDADLRRSRGAGLRADGIVAEGARLEGAEWRGASLGGGRMARVRARGARFDRARLANASFTEADLEGAVFDEADVTGLDLSGARLRGAALAGTSGRPRLDGADLRQADLRSADLAPLLEDVDIPGVRLPTEVLRTRRLRKREAARAAAAERAARRQAERRAAAERRESERRAAEPRATRGEDTPPGKGGAELQPAERRSAEPDDGPEATAGTAELRATPPEAAPRSLVSPADRSLGTPVENASGATVEASPAPAGSGAPPATRSDGESSSSGPLGPGERSEAPTPTPGERALRGVLGSVHERVATLPDAAKDALARLRPRRGARLDGRDLRDQDLTGADLRYASLVDARLEGVRLRSADLRNADLRGARLQGADLGGARLSGARLEGARLEGARFEGVDADGLEVEGLTGLSEAQRRALAAGGAVLPEDGRWVRLFANATAVAVVAVVGVYLAARFSDPTLDSAALEHAASEAQRQGAPAEAAERFDALARQAEDPSARIDYLLEAAASAEEAGAAAEALDRYEEALVLATGNPKEATVRLRRAEAWRRGGLLTAAAAEYREILDSLSLVPTEEAAAVVGLCAADATVDAATEEVTRLDATRSTLERVGLALALADAWSAAGRPDRTRAVLERGIDGVSATDAAPARLRLARALGEAGETDAALATFRALIEQGGAEGLDARLGAAELLARRNDDVGALALLEPVLARTDAVGVRARLSAAAMASRSGDQERATTLLQELLALPEVEPRLADDARLALASILAASDPEAAVAMAESNPRLRDELRLGQARALREAGKRQDARALWVEVAEDPEAGEEARIDAVVSLAELEVQEGDVDGAIRRYTKVLEQGAGRNARERVVLGLANALTRAGKVQEAEAQYDALLAASPSDDAAAQARLGLARAAALRGQSSKAEERYLEVGRTEGPWAVEALDALGQLRARSGNRAGAIEAWRLARTRGAAVDAERRAGIEIELAEALEEAGDPQAREVWEGLLAAEDSGIRARASVAVGQRTLETDPVAARALFETALADLEPGAARSEARAGWLRAATAAGSADALQRARAWLETETDAALRGELAVATCSALRAEGRPAEALQIAETWAADGGFELAMERAGALREVGRPADAVKVLSAARAASVEDRAWLLESRGDAAIEASDWAAADAAFTELESLPQQASAAAYGRARVARERGQLQRALELLNGSNDDRAAVERANVLEGLGQLDEARAAWERLSRSADLEQRSAGVLGLARLALEEDQPKAALAQLDGLKQVAEGYALTVAQVRGDALLALGRHEEARRLYAGLPASGESRVVAQLGLGEVALAESDFSAAITAFRKAEEATSDPTWSAMALAGLCRAQAGSGDRAAAKATFDRLRAAHADQEGPLAAAEAALGP